MTASVSDWEQMPFQVMKASHRLVDIWIGSEENDQADYHYGGTRLVAPDTDEDHVVSILVALGKYESGIKNKLINRALESNVMNGLGQRLPSSFEKSKVYGGRCVIRPKKAEVAKVLEQPESSAFLNMATDIFATIGTILNEQHGRIKLTPDFGRFGGIADILKQFTPNVLGINCEQGGCGGKSSYTVTGITEAIRWCREKQMSSTPVTLIGCAGALGSGVMEYFLDGAPESDLALCDLAYDANQTKPDISRGRVLRALEGRFTDECLSRGGLVVATTVGAELEHSNWSVLCEKTVLLMAHNRALPNGALGIELAREVAKTGTYMVPGQILTLGGALTARLEWFWRQANPGQPFDKLMAHEVVKRIVRFCLDDMFALATDLSITPYEAMLQMALDHNFA